MFLEDDASVDRNDFENLFEEKTHFTIFDEYSEYHIDAKGVYNKFDAFTVKNRASIPYESHTMHIASAEDTIAQPVIWRIPGCKKC